MAVDYKPKGYHTLTTYLVVKDARKQLEFLKAAFDAVPEHVSERPDGTVMHASLTIGDSKIMVGQAFGEYPQMPCAVYMYVPDCDAVYQKALAAGATSKQAPANMFYGDRHGGVVDANGNPSGWQRTLRTYPQRNWTAGRVRKAGRHLKFSTGGTIFSAAGVERLLEVFGVTVPSSNRPRHRSCTTSAACKNG